jgi:hypothetical protein
MPRLFLACILGRLAFDTLTKVDAITECTLCVRYAGASAGAVDLHLLAFCACTAAELPLKRADEPLTLMHNINSIGGELRTCSWNCKVGWVHVVEYMIYRSCFAFAAAVSRRGASALEALKEALAGPCEQQPVVKQEQSAGQPATNGDGPVLAAHDLTEPGAEQGRRSDTAHEEAPSASQQTAAGASTTVLPTPTSRLLQHAASRKRGAKDTAAAVAQLPPHVAPTKVHMGCCPNQNLLKNYLVTALQPPGCLLHATCCALPTSGVPSHVYAAPAEEVPA